MARALARQDAETNSFANAVATSAANEESAVQQASTDADSTMLVDDGSIATPTDREIAMNMAKQAFAVGGWFAEHLATSAKNLFPGIFGSNENTSSATDASSNSDQSEPSTDPRIAEQIEDQQARVIPPVEMSGRRMDDVVAPGVQLVTEPSTTPIP